MALTEQIKIVVEAITHKATADIKAMNQAIGEAEGPLGKTKAAAQGLGGVIGGLANGPLGAGALGGALLAGAKASITAFEESAGAAEDLKEKTGLAADEASRWAVVAGDMGLPVDALASSLGKLDKSIAAGTLDKLTIPIAHLKDGATDVNGTFLNVIRHLQNIPDAAQRAAEGAQVFGKGWQGIADLINRNVGDIQKQLDAVPQTEIFTDEQMDQAKQFKLDMAHVTDEVKGLEIELGGKLVPILDKVVTTWDHTIGKIVGGVQKLRDNMPGFLQTNAQEIFAGFTQTLPGIGPILGGVAAGLTMFSNRAQEAGTKVKGAAERMKLGVDQSAAALNAQSVAAERAAAAQEDLTASTEATGKMYGQVLADEADATQRAIDLEKQRQDLMAKTEDAVLDAVSAQHKANTANDDWSKTLKDSKASTDDRVDAAIALAQANADVAAKQKEANGQALTADDRNKILIDSLTKLQKQADGPTKKAIQGVIDSLKAVPKTVDTKITTEADLTAASVAVARIQAYLTDHPATVDITADDTQAAYDIANFLKHYQNLRLAVGLFATGGTPTSGPPRAAMAGTTIINVPPTLNPNAVLSAVGAGQRRNGDLRRG